MAENFSEQTAKNWPENSLPLARNYKKKTKWVSL